ncbi:MAG: heme ABC transporter permease CcmB, partial [Desulfovibrio sp.]|nr:heme ABC transporter permease CcmB [Desulfovibrio sp.]
WLASLFYAILAFNQLYGLEETNASRQALYLAPAPAQGIWLGKALAGLVLLALAQIVFLPGMAIFLGQDVKGPAWPGLMALAVADIGIAAAGSMLGGLAQGHRAAESLPGIVLFPLLAPLLLAAISLGTASLEDGRELDSLGWLGVGLAFDAIFLGLGLMLSGLLYQGRP